MIKTSIIIPVYNVEKYLKACLDSCMNQTQKEIEIIAVDDGSTDRSLEILREYERLEPRLRVYTQANSGQGPARNKGLQESKGKYVCFVDSDDFIEAETVEKCYAVAEEKQLDVVLYDANSFIEAKEGELASSFKPDVFIRKGIVKEGCVYNGYEYLEQYMNTHPDLTGAPTHYCSRKFIEKFSLWFLPGVYEDVPWRFKVMLCAERVEYMPYPFYNYRYRPGSTMTTEITPKKCRDFIAIIKQMITDAKQCGHKDRHIEKEYIEMRIAALKERCQVAKLGVEKETIAHSCYELVDKFEKELLDPENEEDIRFLAFCCEKFLEVFPEGEFAPKYRLIMSEQEQRIYKVLVDRIKDLPFNEPEKKVGIYGSGYHTNNLLKWYKRLIGEITAQIIYIDSKKESFKEKVNGSDVYNVRDLDTAKPDAVILSSRLYEDEMAETMKRLYDDRYKIYRFYEKSKKPIF